MVINAYDLLIGDAPFAESQGQRMAAIRFTPRIKNMWKRFNKFRSYIDRTETHERNHHLTNQNYTQKNFLDMVTVTH